ncbi:MAG TPA: hypothetical protein VH684_10940 [Xanthobacteraceae bacterium]|jgi:hypothetical protein
MAETARLIIPVWGEAYVAKVLSITLPAALAPGNLPALSGMFDVEVVIVTESRLFDLVRGSRCFQAAEKVCSVRLVPIDDLLSGVFTDYGMVLTYALFRGFADLGARMTETYLLLLNADFVISDGSLRHVGQLMQQGKRVIHAPSFRVVAENVDPQLHALLDRKSCTLSLPPRQLAKLALANKHPTVKARTINQRIFHQEWMDQYYWYVDDDTLIGYQSPMALVAVRPERVVSEPCGFWDYSFLPEAAPTAEPHFIGDSDDFFMIEPQAHITGQEMIRIGWTSFDELARTESLRATREHRRSGEQLITIHAADLPPAIDGVIAESRAFMAELYRRLSSAPASYRHHPLLTRWFDEAGQRRRGVNTDQAPQALDYSPAAIPTVPDSGRGLLASRLKSLRNFYSRMFGSPPQLSKFHPLWADVSPITRKIAAWQKNGQVNILTLEPGNWRTLIIQRQLGDHAGGDQVPLVKAAPYDICVCELTFKELPELALVHAALRPLMKDGGHVLFKIEKIGNVFDGAELFLNLCNFPDVDISEINFRGTAITGFMKTLYRPAMRPLATRPLARGLIICGLIVTAPIVWLANASAARRDPSLFSSTWTSLTVEFTVKRRNAAVPVTVRDRAKVDEAIV